MGAAFATRTERKKAAMSVFIVCDRVNDQLEVQSDHLCIGRKSQFHAVMGKLKVLRKLTQSLINVKLM